MDHVVELGHDQVAVADDRIVRGRALRLLDVLGPPLVVVHGVDAEAEDLGVPLLELRLQLGHVAELGRADRREVLGVREEDRVAVADPLVEVDGSLGGLRLEVRSLVADTD
jgi:hypothetical protein